MLARTSVLAGGCGSEDFFPVSSNSVARIIAGVTRRCHVISMSPRHGNSDVALVTMIAALKVFESSRRHCYDTRVCLSQWRCEGEAGGLPLSAGLGALMLAV